MILTSDMDRRSAGLFFIACKSGILSIENIKKGAKNGNKRISSY